MATNFTVSTKYWHKLDNGTLQCDVCPRHCHLHEGQQGLCFVRARQNDEVVMTSYGRSTGFCIDPIEKKPLNHFYPGSSVLSFGTAGCNLACKFCQNWDISKSRETERLSSEASPRAIAEAAQKYQCKSVAFTYNDPIIFMEYMIDTAIECHRRGIKTVAVTSGYICEEPRKEFFQHIDAANVDLKAFTDDFYKNICGGHLDAVCDTLVYLKHKTNVWLEITTLLIPGKNDSDEELTQACQWIKKELGDDVPLHFSAFHPDWKMLDVPATPKETLTRARDIAMRNGLKYVYTGNVHDPKGSSTYCPQCSTLLIERDWYELGQWNINNEGKCAHCGHTIAGHFETKPGTWGAKRQSVTIAKEHA